MEDTTMMLQMTVWWKCFAIEMAICIIFFEIQYHQLRIVVGKLTMGHVSECWRLGEVLLES